MNSQESPASKQKQAKNANNIFGKARSGQRDSVKSSEKPNRLGGKQISMEEEREIKRIKDLKKEREFENKSLRLIRIREWGQLDELATAHLEET